MRKIKFRAWNKKRKTMHSVSTINFYDEYVDVDTYASGTGERFKLEDVILLQSTGLLDKNGKEIFEGDLVKWKQASGGILPPNENVYTCQIKWIRNEWACEDLTPLKDDYHSCFTFASSHIEVIGNVYQNPELLK